MPGGQKVMPDGGESYHISTPSAGLWATEAKLNNREHRYRRKIRVNTLEPELTEEEAMRLLRISSIQAIYNAKAYCRNFDQLTASQQMALSQLVFQMGVNLEEFVHFLSALNGDTSYRDLSQPDERIETAAEH
jgi:type II secretory pathway component PulL